MDSIALMVYFSGSIDGCTFSYSGGTLTPTQNGPYYYVTIPNIVAQDLGKPYTIKVTDSNNNTYTVTYSAMTYVRTVLNSTTTTRSHKDVCIKLYDYYQAALAFFPST